MLFKVTPDYRMEILPKDRIIKLNDFNLMVTEDFRPQRRNIQCYSPTIATYIKEHNLSKDNIHHVMCLGEYLNMNYSLIKDFKFVFYFSSLPLLSFK